MSRQTTKLVLFVFLTFPFAVHFVSAQVTFDWATVGNPGNDPDQDYGDGQFGAVNYTYRISKYEVTNDQYTQFLNAVDPTGTSPHFNRAIIEWMGTTPQGGISFDESAVSGSKYAIRSNMGNKPVNYVSFYDAMRFVNWLENGQPTDGSGTETGVYTIDNGLTETRTPGATFFIPSEDEWYKAAHYQPASQGGDADDYWLYPTASNTAPTVATANSIGDISNPGANVANYARGADWNGRDGNVTTVGSAGISSASFYGTFDQGGNVAEWNEAVRGPSNDRRGLRGGHWNDSSTRLAASNQGWSGPGTVLPLGRKGLRVASIVTELECDFNADSLCNTSDLDLLYNDVAAGNGGGPTDLDGNGVAENLDIAEWLALAGAENGKTYLPGDTNLDGEVDGPDFTTLATFFGNAGSNPNDATAYWRHGNFDGRGSDGTFDVGGPDFTSLATYFGHASVLSVPEPSHDWFLIGVICLFSFPRRYMRWHFSQPLEAANRKVNK